MLGFWPGFLAFWFGFGGFCLVVGALAWFLGLVPGFGGFGLFGGGFGLVSGGVGLVFPLSGHCAPHKAKVGTQSGQFCKGRPLCRGRRAPAPKWHGGGPPSVHWVKRQAKAQTPKARAKPQKLGKNHKNQATTSRRQAKALKNHAQTPKMPGQNTRGIELETW